MGWSLKISIKWVIRFLRSLWNLMVIWGEERLLTMMLWRTMMSCGFEQRALTELREKSSGLLHLPQGPIYVLFCLKIPLMIEAVVGGSTWICVFFLFSLLLGFEVSEWFYWGLTCLSIVIFSSPIVWYLIILLSMLEFGDEIIGILVVTV